MGVRGQEEIDLLCSFVRFDALFFSFLFLLSFFISFISFISFFIFSPSLIIALYYIVLIAWGIRLG